jgi:hypothetical protein
MPALWNRIPTLADWLVALIAAFVTFNINVTDVGDPLSGVGLSAGPTAGITEGARSTFYGSMVVGGLVLAAAGLALAAIDHGPHAVASLLARTYGGVALAGFAGLLLDYRDGPVRMVQLVAYLMLFLGIVRFVRIAGVMSDADSGSRP